MATALRWAALLVVFTTALASAQTTGKYSIKQEKSPPPKELDVSIQKLLSEAAVQFLNAKGEAIAEVWLRKEIPVEATPEQVKNGLTYREIPQSTILGAVRFDQRWTDYRKQNVKPGVYTIRFALQPENGDHQGTAPYPEFGVLVAAGKDMKAGPVELEKLNQLSASSIGTSHPAVFLLFPNNKPAATPQLAARDAKTVVLNVKGNVTVQGEAAGSLGIGLTLVGYSE